MKANDDASLLTKIISRIPAIRADRSSMTDHDLILVAWNLNLSRERRTRRYCSVGHLISRSGAA